MISDTFNDNSVINLKLGDFGFDCKFENIEETWTKLGTALYAAPEIDEGGGYGYKADIWYKLE